MSDYLTPKQLCQRWGLERRAVYRRLRRMPILKQNARVIRIAVEDVQRLERVWRIHGWVPRENS
ncbi:MAG TPA: hypothetical protein VFF65_04240 [Phycisphaerales bacterium]|nr:hypothetical protein [Phycisphaerales bacterium]